MGLMNTAESVALASPPKKQDLQPPVRLKLSKLYEQLHFNQLCLHDYHSRRTAAARNTELAFSPVSLGQKMKRLRLRPSPPTPGERNLRLHWQQNSAACNELLKNQRQTASAPTLQRTSTVKNPSLKLNFNSVSQFRPNKRPSTANKVLVSTSTESQKITSKPRNSSPQSINAFIRSQTHVDLIRSSLQRQTRIKIPQTPLNSPDAGIRVVRVTSKWREPERKETSDEKTNKKQLNTKIAKDSNRKNQNIFEHYSDSTLCSTDVKQGSNNSNSQKKILGNPTSVSLSNQVLGLRKHFDSSFAKTDWMKIKSFHRKTDVKLKRSSFRKRSEFLQKYQNQTSDPVQSINTRGLLHGSKEEKLNAENPTLQIGHSQAWQHDNTLKFSPEISQSSPNHQLRWKRTVPHHQSWPHQKIKEFYRKTKTKFCDVSITDERHLVVPNPSLVDFGKHSTFTSQENESKSNNVYENDQDPAVMLRILSWLEKVENNSEFYYGFDSEKF